MRRERGTSQPPMAKSRSIKDAGRRSGGCAWKAVELTSGDLRVAASESGLGKSRGNPNAAQKSAAGIVRLEPEGPNGGRDVSVNLKDEQRQKTQTDWPARTSEWVKPGRSATGSELPLAKHEVADLVETRILSLGFTAEPPCADPHARWCGRGRAVRLPPIPIRRRMRGALSR
jgi:hypothetical protein